MVSLFVSCFLLACITPSPSPLFVSSDDLSLCLYLPPGFTHIYIYTCGFTYLTCMCSFLSLRPSFSLLRSLSVSPILFGRDMYGFTQTRQRHCHPLVVAARIFVSPPCILGFASPRITFLRRGEGVSFLLLDGVFK